eukprot:6208057-Pleurochrysis_carterae.AAC.3
MTQRIMAIARDIVFVRRTVLGGKSFLTAKNRLSPRVLPANPPRMREVEIPNRVNMRKLDARLAQDDMYSSGDGIWQARM